MSALPSEASPQILVNGEEQRQQQDGPAMAEEQISAVGLDEERLEDSASAEKQDKMQSVLQQVRNQIRSQAKAPKNSILELVQRVKDQEIARVNGKPEDTGVSSEERIPAETLTDESKDEKTLREEELCAIFDKKLEASKETLRDEFGEQISQLRADVQAYTERALKDLECKMQSYSLQQPRPREPQESKGLDRKQRPSAAPSLAARRGRVLTRTMTTIIPKTCAPVIVCQRAKSETLSSSKFESSRFALRDPVPSIPGRKLPLPPTCPPLHQRKNPVRVKAKTGN